MLLENTTSILNHSHGEIPLAAPMIGGGEASLYVTEKTNTKKYRQHSSKSDEPFVVSEYASQQLLFVHGQVPFPTPKNSQFKFIDLFAGIGGFRLALQNLGGECVFTSEWDKDAQKTYRANFGETPHGGAERGKQENIKCEGQG